MKAAIMYFEVNLVCAAILILLALKLRRSTFWLQEPKRYFVKVVAANTVFLLIDGLWAFIDNNAFVISVQLNWLLNCAYYMVSGFVGLSWFQYSESEQDSKLVREKRYRIICCIPAVLLILLTLLSLKTGLLFYIDENNTYQRGPAYALQLLTSYGYVIFTAIKAFIKSFSADDYVKKRQLRALAVFVLPTLITGGLQVIYPGYPILCMGNAFGIMYVYLSKMDYMVSLDMLTKLNNRHHFYQHLSAKFSSRDDQKTLYLMMMDVDYFKTINDQYGHIEGDKALMRIAECLKNVCKRKHTFAARYGGDEFIVLCELGKDERIKTICDKIHAELRKQDVPYRLTASIGYAKLAPEMQCPQDLIEAADRELYKVKAHRK